MYKWQVSLDGVIVDTFELDSNCLLRAFKYVRITYGPTAVPYFAGRVGS